VAPVDDEADILGLPDIMSIIGQRLLALQPVRGGPEEPHIVVEVTEPLVTRWTEQSAHVAAAVAVVYDKSTPCGWCAIQARTAAGHVSHFVLMTPTDGTPTVLGNTQRLHLLRGYSIEPPEVVPTIDVHGSIHPGTATSLVLAHPRAVALALLGAERSVTRMDQWIHLDLSRLRYGLIGPALSLALLAGSGVGRGPGRLASAVVLPATTSSTLAPGQVAAVARVVDGSWTPIVVGHSQASYALAVTVQRIMIKQATGAHAQQPSSRSPTPLPL